MSNILFIVENDYFPRDARVYNECMSLVKNDYNCFVIAPKQKNEKIFEKLEDKISCYRFPHFESRSLIGLPWEYLNALIWIFIYTSIISLTKKIRLIHVANPPDFIIPVLLPLKILRIEFIFDIHDLSVETFKAKGKSGIIPSIIIIILEIFEKISTNFSTLIISTNTSIREYIENKYNKSNVKVIRNSNEIKFLNVNQIVKNKTGKCIIGYFGVINDDYASGYQNLVELAKLLIEKKFDFHFEVIGNGGGLVALKELVARSGAAKYFTFKGFIPLEKSFDYIKNFDFGIVPWPNIPKNNLHTAMKVMDYMCCGVPVCSLTLREQMVSTNGIGIHKATFDEIATELISIYDADKNYEILRCKTLEHFNKNLAWEIQERELIRCYDSLLKSNMRN